jgi:hypothetical protein
MRMKYGEEYLKILVKSDVGTGMIENPSWNNGKPYFVNFRPIIHSVEKLSNIDLEKYAKYNTIIEDIEYQLSQLKDLGTDVFDIEIELKLAKTKLKESSFNMVDIYLEGLTPRITGLWTKLNKKPKKYEKKYISLDDIRLSVKTSEKIREKLPNPNEQKSENETENKTENKIDNNTKNISKTKPTNKPIKLQSEPVQPITPKYKIESPSKEQNQKDIDNIKNTVESPYSKHTHNKKETHDNENFADSSNDENLIRESKDIIDKLDKNKLDHSQKYKLLRLKKTISLGQIEGLDFTLRSRIKKLLKDLNSSRK